VLMLMGRRTHHIKTGLPVCCEQALKGVGEQNTHGGGGAGALGKPPARGRVEGLCIWYESGGLIGGGGLFPCWQIAG
jgi:hypothetical protein